MKSISKKRRGISKIAVGDQHGIFQHFQSNTTDYATRERYLSQRGGEAPIGRDTESLYNIAPEGADSRVPTEYVAPHLSTRYSPDRVGIQAQRVSDGVYQDPYTNKIYDYNEGFKTEDGRSFPGGSASLQSSLSRMANALDSKGFSKEADRLDGVLKKVAVSFIPKKIDPFRVKITGGRFEGGQGTASDRYDDGVFGIDLDEPMHDSARGFATEDEIERSDASTTEEFSDLPSNLEEENVKEINELLGEADWSLGKEPGLMNLADIIKALVLSHRDPESGYKLSEDRLRDLTPHNLTEDEEQIVGTEKTSLAHMTNSLVSISNTLDDLGLDQASDELDLTIKSLASRLKARPNLSPIVSVASSLDEYGLNDVSDILDTWMSKNR